MPVRRGHVAPQNTFIDTIIRKFDGQSKYSYFSSIGVYIDKWRIKWMCLIIMSNELFVNYKGYVKRFYFSVNIPRQNINSIGVISLETRSYFVGNGKRRLNCHHDQLLTICSTQQCIAAYKVQVLIEACSLCVPYRTCIGECIVYKKKYKIMLRF